MIWLDHLKHKWEHAIFVFIYMGFLYLCFASYRALGQFKMGQVSENWFPKIPDLFL